MQTLVWRSRDIRNVLLSLYASQAARPQPAGAEPGSSQGGRDLYLRGFRVALEALFLAFGLPLEPLADAGARMAATEGIHLPDDVWVLSDIANVLEAVAFAGTVPDDGARHLCPPPAYQRGFLDLLAAAVRAFGLAQADSPLRHRLGPRSLLALEERAA